LLEATKGIVELSLIKNKKTVDPSDSQSTPVYQIECAMGDGVGLFEDSTYISVDRSRFLPVKTTNDLLVLRSDKFCLDAEYRLISDSSYEYPKVDLDPRYYKLVDDFDARFKYVPSLQDAIALSVSGDFVFDSETKIVGNVSISSREDLEKCEK
jgi:UTP--glucose-1-phosphate uridylyltransferase